jgi:nucleotide-binding universal stress UspA family protein
VTSAATATATPPLASVRARVVVGFDGSPGAEQALLWAADEAALRHADLEVVYCWARPPAITPAAAAMSVEVSGLLEASARRRVDDGARVARLRRHEVAVRPVVIEGPTGPSLVERGQGAGLLVVGRRGRSAPAELLLGSTSAYCLHHAQCPVVVLPSATSHRRRCEDGLNR